MSETIFGLVTDVVRHSDRHNVVTLYTPTRGRVSCLSPAGTGRAARLRSARLQPLSVIEAEIRFRPGRELHSLGRLSVVDAFAGLRVSPVKTAVTLFLQDFLRRFLRESPPDSSLWTYIVSSLRFFSNQRSGTANFHICFTIGLLEPAGIKPDFDDADSGSYFDMRAGRFAFFPPTHQDFVAPAEASFLPKLARMNLLNMHRFRFSAAQRRRILSGLLRYYSIHLPGLASLRSPEVLADIFSAD